MEIVLSFFTGMALAGSLLYKRQANQRQRKIEWRNMAIEAGNYRRRNELNNFFKE